VGSGQTTKVAKWLNRRFVGYDTVEEYVQLARERLEEPLSVRPEQLIAVFSKVGLHDPTKDPGNRAPKQGGKTKKEASARPLPLFSGMDPAER